ncbi:hypothetical protein TNCV_2975051 [Trichonephila clavipes]|nr:hypothetical protein TNCV_2975051 [Trichonephila clavipes]
MFKVSVVYIEAGLSTLWNRGTRRRSTVSTEVQAACRRATKSICEVTSSRYTNSLRLPHRRKIQRCPKREIGSHQTCLSINRLWHELCDMLRRLVGTTAPGHHDCSIQE